MVDVVRGTCSCPDHEDRGGRCKHQWAVAYVRRETRHPDGTTTVDEALLAAPVEDAGPAPRRPTYAQDWPAYDAAQKEEKARVRVLLRELCDGVTQPPRAATGRPRLPLGDVVYGAAMRVYTTLPGRRATTDLRDCADRGLLDREPGCSSVFRYLERPELAPLLGALVQRAAAPLRAVESAFAVDSTGFATSTYARWHDEKYGGERRCQRWVKAHAQVGTATHVICAVEVTEADVGDAPVLPRLVRSASAAGFALREVSADKAYLSNDNLAVIEAAGARPYMQFKTTSRGDGDGASDAWRRLWHLYSAHREEFLAHYHRRSNVESAFSMVKRKFGASVRARVPAAQRNEVLLKCLCHNLSVLVHSARELGLDVGLRGRPGALGERSGGGRAA